MCFSKPTATSAYAFAHRLVGSHADAEDVLQTAWLRAFRGIGRFGGRARFMTWLWRILMRTAADHERRSRRRAPLRGLEEMEALQPEAAHSDPSETAAAAEFGDALHEAMGSLPIEQRAALVLVVFDGMTYAQAAQVQNCPEGTIAWRIAQARRKLCERLAPHLESDEEPSHEM